MTSINEKNEIAEDYPDVNEMIKILAEKLTKKELVDLFILMDGDPPVGPLYCGLCDIAVKTAPELFLSAREADKEEVIVHGKRV